MLTGEEEQKDRAEDKKLSGRDFFVKTMESGKNVSIIDIGEVVDEKRSGDRAVLTVKREIDEDDPGSALMADTTEVEMVLENGSWKIVLETKTGF
ncbi:MAG: hypothetical protein ACLFQB_16085 [Chitinispirillaceae bacterium]